MPLYEYQCESCGKTFEIIQKFSDAPLTVHKECGGELHRLFSPPALRFKGTGWYVTDYAHGNGSASNGSNGHHEDGKKAEPKPESKSVAKSESKPESKPAG
ncbi:MAG: FmdB family zinc ribbon protein [Bryobacteraceae bacterium]